MSQITFNLIVGTLLRSAIMLLAGWLVAHGMLPEGSKEEWVGALVLVVLGVAWSVYQKLEAKAHLHAAMQLPAGATIEEVQDKVAANKALGTVAKAVLPFLVATSLLASTGCGKTPPNLDPETQKMYEATEVARRINRLQAVVIDLEAQQIIQTDVARTIIRFTGGANKTMLAYPNGWGPTVTGAWVFLKANPDVQNIFAKNPTLAAVVQLVDVALAIWLPKQEAACSFSCSSPLDSPTRGYSSPRLLWSGS